MSNTEPKEEEKQNMVSAKDRETTGPISGFKMMLLALMVVQNSSTVLVGRYTRSSVGKDELFVVNHLVMVTEIAKVRLFDPSNVNCKRLVYCLANAPFFSSTSYCTVARTCLHARI